jgi:hypothetical protein
MLELMVKPEKRDSIDGLSKKLSIIEHAKRRSLVPTGI